MQLRVISALLFFAVVINSGDAGYKCYHCSTESSSSCGDPFKEEGVSTCKSDYGCMKGKGKTTVMRGCLTTDASAYECVSDKDSALCYCKTDLCNSASFQQATVTSVVALLVCAVIAFRRL
ncbi:hypothetical protein LSAT2_026246 [Lamellibrachia satsuma]|nr:hypothetical protein LSAT2_026246 [Lamellibrachia satsuma]